MWSSTSTRKNAGRSGVTRARDTSASAALAIPGMGRSSPGASARRGCTPSPGPNWTGPEEVAVGKNLEPMLLEPQQHPFDGETRAERHQDAMFPRAGAVRLHQLLEDEQ